MSDEDNQKELPKPSRKVFIRRDLQGMFRTAYPTSRHGPGVTPEDNLVLRQLQSMRGEMKVILERHVRDRELVVRLGERIEAGFENVRSDIRELRSEMKELRSDVISLENKLLTNQNEILDIVRRLDEAEANPFEYFEIQPEDVPAGEPETER